MSADLGRLDATSDDAHAADAAVVHPETARRRGRRATLATATLATVLLVAGTAVGPSWLTGDLGRGHPAVPSSPTGQVSLPQEFAPYSGLTASAQASPAGRAIALYESGSSELFTTWQTLVAGADRDTYREVAVGGAVRLSPDGKHLFFYRARVGTDEFTLLDLTTGRSRVLHSVTWRSNVGAGPEMLAWSPDGRYVAYAVPPTPTGRPAEDGFFDGRAIQELAILDVVNDSTKRYSDISPVWGAAFAPDSRRLAVQTGHEAWIVTVHGQRVRPLSLPQGMNLVSDTAWSPDGALIAVANDHVMGFVDATGKRRKAPNTLQLRRLGLAWDTPPLLGWRDSTTLLSMSGDDGGDVGIVELNISTGQKRMLSRFSTAQVCEYGSQRCFPYRVQLATGLIASATIRPSDPDRGPWPTTLKIAAIGSTFAGVLIAWWVFRSVRRRSRLVVGRGP